jgi:hypothetical protein
LPYNINATTVYLIFKFETYVALLKNPPELPDGKILNVDDLIADFTRRCIYAIDSMNDKQIRLVLVLVYCRF